MDRLGCGKELQVDQVSQVSRSLEVEQTDHQMGEQCSEVIQKYLLYIIQQKKQVLHLAILQVRLVELSNGHEQTAEQSLSNYGHCTKSEPQTRSE